MDKGKWIEVKSRSVFLDRKYVRGSAVDIRIPWPADALPEKNAAMPKKVGRLEKGSGQDVWFVAFPNGTRVELPARFEAKLL